MAHRDDELSDELAQTTDQLNHAASLYAEVAAKEPVRLPMLGQISIAAPCNVDWTSMSGDERERFCGSCKQNVYNLSGLTKQEAEDLIEERHGNLCVRYYARKDGTILLADCSVGVKRRKRVNRTLAASAIALLGVATGGNLIHQHHAPMRTTVAPKVAEVTPVSADPWDGPVHQMINIDVPLPPPPVPPVPPVPVLDTVPELEPEIHVKMGAVAVRPPIEDVDPE